MKLIVPAKSAPDVSFVNSGCCSLRGGEGGGGGHSPTHLSTKMLRFLEEMRVEVASSVTLCLTVAGGIQVPRVEQTGPTRCKGCRW